MKQRDFETQHLSTWQRLEKIIADCSDGKSKSKAGKESNAKQTPPTDFPELYRQVCGHLSMARQRHYSQNLVTRINQMVIAGHQMLYQHDNRFGIRNFVQALAAFPQALRRNAVYLMAAGALFIVPLLAMGLACYLDESIIYSVVSPEQVREVESMYEPSSDKIGRERGSDTDVMMFGFYIYNNIGIAFREFAGGILFGLGSVFYLFYNGIYIGAIAGRLTHVGYEETFYPFVIGHGAFELTAIVFAGAAGLKIGAALISPGNYSRLHALKISAKEAVIIMYGSTAMLLIAAFLEAFWSSSSSLPISVKLSVGTLFWLIVIWFCFFSRIGRVPTEKVER